MNKNESNKRYRNSEKGQKTIARYKEQNKDKLEAYKQSEAYRLTQRKAIFKHRYGITLDQYNDLLAAQNNKCAICSIEFDSSIKGKTPHIDHDHSTGIVRGLLCHKCNLVIGHADDSIEVLKSAIDYLARK